jgi:uncharacterized membrane protein
MSLDQRTITLILAMTAAAALCRFAGFWFMRFIPLTARVQAGLQAIPLAVMLGIIVPPALRGGVPELLGIAATGLAVYGNRNELVGVLFGILAVAAARGFGL